MADANKVSVHIQRSARDCLDKDIGGRANAIVQVIHDAAARETNVTNIDLS